MLVSPGAGVKTVVWPLVRRLMAVVSPTLTTDRSQAHRATTYMDSRLGRG